MSNPTTLLLMDNLRARLGGAADDAIFLELFNTCDEVAREALRETAPINPDADAATWLPADQWVPAYQALLNGTLARMYAQLGKPYSSDTLAAQHLAQYLKYLDLARTESSGTPLTIQQRLLSSLRVQVPAARDSALQLELYNTISKIRAEALQLDPLNGDEALAYWLPSDTEWERSHLAALHGTLSGMFSQLGREWSNAALAAAHLTLFNSELDQLRAEASDDPATAYGRLLSDLRVQVPFARDAALKLEIYNTVDKIRREALRVDPLAGTETDTDEWLTEEQYGQCYHAILHGTLNRLFLQVGKPWSNPDLASRNYTRYGEELDLVRGEEASEPDTALVRLMDMLRVRLVGARDEIIKMELFSVLDELFRTSHVWQEDIPFSVNTTTKTYDIESEENTAKVIRLIAVVNSSDIPVFATMAVPEGLVLRFTPSASEVYTATVALTLTEPTTADGYPRFPNWVVERYFDALQDGVQGRMMSQVGKPYSNERMSIYHLRRWRNAMAQAGVDAQHKNVHGAQAWRFPRGWR